MKIDRFTLPSFSIERFTPPYNSPDISQMHNCLPSVILMKVPIPRRMDHSKKHKWMRSFIPKSSVRVPYTMIICQCEQALLLTSKMS